MQHAAMMDPAHLITTLSYPSRETCVQVCTDTPTCGGVSYSPDSLQCRLLKMVEGIPTEAENWITWNKKCRESEICCNRDQLG